jgi:hypothetical protein
MRKEFDGAGRTVAAYIEACVREAERDAVAFGEVVWWGRQQFEFADDELESFVRMVLSTLIQRGARVVRAFEPTQGYGWELLPQYQLLTIEETVQKLIEDSHHFDRNQDFFAWLTFECNLSPSTSGK